MEQAHPGPASHHLRVVFSNMRLSNCILTLGTPSQKCRIKWQRYGISILGHQSLTHKLTKQQTSSAALMALPMSLIHLLLMEHYKTGARRCLLPIPFSCSPYSCAHLALEPGCWRRELESAKEAASDPSAWRWPRPAFDWKRLLDDAIK